LAAFLANLPQQRDEPLLVDIYELYQEILARYQTRLHSDDRVWHAEIDANNAQGALAQHIQEQGETLDCSGRVQTTDAAVCQRREILERDAEESMERYIEALQTVNNEMIDNGLMPLMDEQMSNQSQAREMFAATTVAVIGVFVPLTLQDAAIDALTAGLGRIRRVGDALAEIARTVRGAGRASLNRVRNITDDAVDRIQDVRRGRVPNAGEGDRFRPQQPLDANGNPIIRTNDRGSVQIQPNGSVTCGQHSCGMVLNTQGNPVAVDDLIRSHPPNVPGEGSTPDHLQRLLRDNGINSVYRPSASIDALSRWTSQGRPAIATVRTGPDTYHAVVVDGVTMRGGQRVVAIRDPAGRPNGGVYYETVSSFRNRFTGDVIRIVL
jgi:hypothetical protein